MTPSELSGNWEAEPSARSGGVARLDLIRHPYGPCPAALEAIGYGQTVSKDALLADLRRRLAELHRVPADTIHVFAGIESALSEVVNSIEGPLIGFPPSRSGTFLEESWPKRSQVLAARGFGRFAGIDLECAADLPERSIALLESPSDPLGTVLAPADLVRIARSCRYVIVDERYAEFATRSLLPIAIEFDNVVVIRSFEVWAGLDRFPLSWVVGSPTAMRLLPDVSESIDADAVAAAIATLGDLAVVEATMRLIRDERSRLYRLLRKFAFLEPLPSWAPFVTARVSFGSRDDVVAGLSAHGVMVHAPDQVGLEAYIRFGLGTRSEMNRLHHALRAIAPVIVG